MRQIEDDTSEEIANSYLNCEECYLSLQVRQLYRCGYLPESQWIDNPARPFVEYGATVCPGYTVSLPQVIEASRLLRWRKDGQLQVYLGHDENGRPVDLPPIAKECIDILDGTSAAVESEVLRRAAKGKE